jgi:hypothetical protein
MDEIISYKMCAVKVRNAKLRNYLNWGEPERAPQFGGSSSSSAMHDGRLYVRTRNFCYSDLNPTGFSPHTGYFENFQSYSDLQ